MVFIRINTSCNHTIVRTYLSSGCTSNIRWTLTSVHDDRWIVRFSKQFVSYISKRQNKQRPREISQTGEIRREDGYIQGKIEIERKLDDRSVVDETEGRHVPRVNKRECIIHTSTVRLRRSFTSKHLISKLKSKFFGPRLRSKHLRKPLPEYFLNASRLTKDARGSFFYTHCRVIESI